MNLDPNEVEHYLKAAKLSPRRELIYRLALAGLSPRTRNTPHAHARMTGLTQDELAQITREARELEQELRTR